MDGVIIDSEPTHQSIETQMFNELGLSLTEEEHLSFVGTSSQDMWTALKSRFDVKMTPVELLHLGRNLYWEALENGQVPLVEGVVDLIGQFHKKGYKLQVASSATRPTIHKVLEYFSLEHFFGYIIGGDDVKKSKPDPEIFYKAAGQSGSFPSQCLVIEDSANGTRAAKAAGMYCIGFINPGSGNQDLSVADVIVNKLSEIDVRKINELILK